MSNLPISRPLLIALIGVALAGGAFMLTRGGGEEEFPPLATQPMRPVTGETGKTAAQKRKAARALARARRAAKKKRGATGQTGSTGATDQTGKGGATETTGGAKGPAGAGGKSRPTRAEIRRARARKLRDAARRAGLPVNVYKAKRAGKIVLIFFWEPRGEDDQVTNDAVAEVDRTRARTVVFRDRVHNTSRYDGISEATLVNRAPAIVILFRSRGKLVEGYVDAGTLKQKINEVVHPTGGARNPTN